MNTINLEKILNDSSFPEITKIFSAYINKRKNLIIIECKCDDYWPGKGFLSNFHTLLLYNLSNFQFIDFIDNLEFDINDIAFHPSTETLAIALGENIDDVAFLGNLLVWDYQSKKISSLLINSIEVLNCNFTQDGNNLCLEVNATDVMENFHYDIKEYKIVVDKNKKYNTENLEPLKSYSLNSFENNNHKANLENLKLSSFYEFAKRLSLNFNPRYSILDILFINEYTIANSVSDSIIEIWNIDESSVRKIYMPKNGRCGELFYNKTTNSILVNQWIHKDRTANTNLVSQIDLDSFDIIELFECNHTISKNYTDHFLFRKSDHSETKAKDFIFTANFEKLHEIDLGYYDQFNHFLRIDNSESFYFLKSYSPKPWLNKILFSLNPLNLSIERIIEIENFPYQYNNLLGLETNKMIIMTGKKLTNNHNSLEKSEHRLFCIDTSQKTIKWDILLEDRVSTLSSIDNGKIIILAYFNGNLELYETESGIKIETITRTNFSAKSPLSIASLGNTIALGLKNAEIEIYKIIPNEFLRK